MGRNCACPRPPEQVLAAHLLHELSKSQAAVTAASGPQTPPTAASRWQLYLEQLPRSYTTLCNWSASDAEELQLDHAREAAAAAALQAREQWREVQPLLKDLGGCCWWGSCDVCGRVPFGKVRARRCEFGAATRGIPAKDSWAICLYNAFDWRTLGNI